jgi:hypothetical protein
MRLSYRLAFIRLSRFEIPGQKNWVARMRRLSDAGLFAIRNGARG